MPSWAGRRITTPREQTPATAAGTAPLRWTGWLPAALLAWLPIAGAVVLVTAARLVMLMMTWNRLLAGALSVLPGIAVVLWATWSLFRHAGRAFGPVRGRVALV